MTLWEQIINGKYKKWINVCAPIHFIFEITEHTYDIIITIDWDKYERIETNI